MRPNLHLQELPLRRAGNWNAAAAEKGFAHMLRVQSILWEQFLRLHGAYVDGDHVEPMFSFTGNKKSMWGTSNFYGKGAVNFYTQWKTITARWKEPDSIAMGMSTAMPQVK